MRSYINKLLGGLAAFVALMTFGVTSAHADVASAIDTAEGEVSNTVDALTPYLVYIGGAFLVLAAIFLAFRIATRSIKAGKLSG